ncbi:MAG TPA: hypothetical protein VK081_05425 [Planctomycetota bacterium]|nr:hypothetical protein [Planctomycetota bacterium]
MAPLARCAFVSAFLLAFPAARAQDATAAPGAEATPILRVDVAGPAAWRAHFLPTNLGSLLSSSADEELLAPWVARFDAWWGGLHGERRAEARARLLAFGGRATIGLWGVPDRAGMQVYGAVALVPEAGGDAGALVDLVRPLLRLMPERSEERIDGRAWTVARGPVGCCTVPEEIEGRVVAWIAERPEHLERAVRDGLAWLRAGAGHDAASEPLRVTLDLARALRLDPSTASDPAFEVQGYGSLRELSLVVGTDGPRVRLDVALQFGAGERGIFAGFFPECAGVPALGALVTPRAVAWLVGRMDAAALWRTCLRSVAKVRGMPEAELLAATRKDLGGVDPGAELFGRLRDEVVILGRAPDDGGEPPVADSMVCIAMPVTDAAAFRVALARALRTRGFVVEETGGALRADYEDGWLLPRISFAAEREWVLVAFGTDGGLQLEAMLKAARGGQAGPPAEAEAARRRAPPGFQGIGALAVEAFLDVCAEVFREGFGAGAVPAQVADLGDWVRRWPPLLREHGLARLLVLTGCVDGRFRVRALW